MTNQNRSNPPIAVASGITKREHFASLLAAGLMANPAYQDRSLYTLVDWAIDASDRLVEKLDELDGELEEEIKPVHEMTDEDKFHQECYRPLYSTGFVKRP